MTQIGFKKMMPKIKSYFKDNWGSPFIVGFIVLLIITASFLSAGLSSLADTVAVYAYYVLVAGVFIELVCYLKYRNRSGEEVVI